MFRLTDACPAKFVSIAALLCLAAVSAACVAVPSPSSQPDAVQQDAPRTPEFSTTEIPADKLTAPEVVAPAAQDDCPGLDSALAQVAASPDPLEQVKQSLMTVRDGKIQVVLVLNQENTSFLQSFDVEIGAQSGTQIQAFVPPDRLCDLAKTDEVLAINPAAQALPQ